VYCCSCFVWVLLSFVYFLYCVCIGVFTLDAGLLARSQYSEGPATGHLHIGFSRFPCAYKQMLRWFPRFQVATTCFSCGPPDLNSVVTDFMFCLHVKPLPPGDNQIAVNKYYYYYYYYYYYHYHHHHHHRVAHMNTECNNIKTLLRNEAAAQQSQLKLVQPGM